MKKWLIRIGVLFLILIVGIVLWAFYNMRDRHPGYEVAINIQSSDSKVPLNVGFGKQTITPTIIDTWNDVNEDARYKEEDGDSYNDNNNNGKFDAVWIAGFSNAKPANGVHDDVWARAVVVDDGATRIAMVALDAVGFMYNDVVDIRLQIPDEWGIDYALIASTHTHESNDLIGIWGPDEYHSGVDPDHLKYVKSQTVKAISDAVSALRPAKIILADDLSGRDSILIKDTRKPIVKATGIHVMQVIDALNGRTLGSIVNWANHPETLWNKNLMISSDFPHYVRESLESGIVYKGDSIQAGLGGQAIFFNGAVGGLMTPHHSLAYNDPVRDTFFKEPSFEKTRTLGEQIALLAIDALHNADTMTQVRPIGLQAASFNMPLKNTNFRIASAIGLLQRGTPKIFQTRTETAVFTIGPATFLSIPGEIYPEILYGGIESPPGRDFLIDPLEIPPLQDDMGKEFNFFLGLANDEIGYIIPKSEWDNEEPWLYLDENDTYGEENSLGPDTGPIIYKKLKEQLKLVKMLK